MAVSDLTDRAKDKALALLFRNADVGLSRKGKEIDDTGYNRQAVNPTEPGGALHGLRAIHNAKEITFGPWVGDAPDGIDGWFVATVDGVMARGDFDRRRKPERGDELIIHSGEMVLGLR